MEDGTWRGGAPTHCLPDKLTFGLCVEVAGLLPYPETDFRHALSSTSFLRGTSGSTLRLEVPVSVGAATVRANLDVRGTPEGVLIFTRASVIELNGLRILRALLGDEASGRLGLDGNDNVVGPLEGRQAELLALVLPAISEAVEKLHEVLAGALPRHPDAPAFEVLVDALWLKSAEACADIAATDALRLAGVQRWAPAPGSVETRSAAYTGASATPAGGWPVTTWKRGGGLLWKVYAKRPDLLRCEVACQSRAAVRSCMGAFDTEIGGAGAVALVESFLACVDEEVAALVHHVRSVELGDASRADLVHALDPLYRLAWPEVGARGRGASLSPETQTKAWEAYSDLLETGLCRPKGLPTKGKLRVTLDQLAEPNGPLARQGREAIYCLAPRFALAFSASKAEKASQDEAPVGAIRRSQGRTPER